MPRLIHCPFTHCPECHTKLASMAKNEVKGNFWAYFNTKVKVSDSSGLDRITPQCCRCRICGTWPVVSFRTGLHATSPEPLRVLCSPLAYNCTTAMENALMLHLEAAMLPRVALEVMFTLVTRYVWASSNSNLTLLWWEAAVIENLGIFETKSEY